jgi:hypothetical protein
MQHTYHSSIHRPIAGAVVEYKLVAEEEAAGSSPAEAGRTGAVAGTAVVSLLSQHAPEG